MIRARWFRVKFDCINRTFTPIEALDQKQDWSFTSNATPDRVVIKTVTQEMIFPNSIVTFVSSLNGVSYGRNNTHVVFAYYINYDVSYFRIYFCGDLDSLKRFMNGGARDQGMLFTLKQSGGEGHVEGDGTVLADMNVAYQSLVETGKFVNNPGHPTFEQHFHLFELPKIVT